MNVTIIPYKIISLFTSDNERKMHLNALFSTIIIIFTFNILRTLPHFCFFQMVFNIPCPGCGILTSVYSITKFEFVESFIYHPVGFILVIFYLSQIPLRLIALIEPIKLGNKIKNFLNIYSTCIITSLMLVWIIKLFGGIYGSVILS